MAKDKAELSKDDVEQKALRSYKKIFKGLPEDRRFLAEQVYTNAAFLTAEIFELKRQVRESGSVAEQVNGNGFVKKDITPEAKVLADYIVKHNSCISTLGGLCPELKKAIAAASDELMMYIGAGKK